MIVDCLYSFLFFSHVKKNLVMSRKNPPRKGKNTNKIIETTNIAYDPERFVGIGDICIIKKPTKVQETNPYVIITSVYLMY